MDIYLVGGAVRDTLLNLAVKERDWVVVGASPERMLHAGYTPVGRDFPVFLHPFTKEEYALARTERKTGPGYTGFDCYAAPDVTLEDDLLRRDLTINAIAQAADGTLIDPYGGRQDLDDRVLRHVSDAFTEDPLRVLRVARFAARFHHLGFSIAEETLTLMQQISRSGELQHLSQERVWKEMERALGEANPAEFFTTLTACDALTILFTELCPFTSEDAARLNAAHCRQLDTRQSFALLCWPKPAASIRQLCEHLHAPNAYRELALLCCEHLNTLRDSMLPLAEQLTLLQQVDAYRRPERFVQLLAIADFIDNTSACSQHWRRNLSLCLSVDASALVARGLKGTAIGEALYQQRLMLLQTDNRQEDHT